VEAALEKGATMVKNATVKADDKVKVLERDLRDERAFRSSLNDQYNRVERALAKITEERDALKADLQRAMVRVDHQRSVIQTMEHMIASRDGYIAALKGEPPPTASYHADKEPPEQPPPIAHQWVGSNGKQS
jgi:chromosome segregation ATPase